MVRRTTVLTAVACGMTVALGACKKGNDNAADTMAGAMTPADSAGMAAPMPAPSAAAPMTDAQIVAQVAAANQGEIDAGKMAETKATNADVKAFARMMVTDHTKMLNDGNALAKRINVVPEAAAADSINTANKGMADQLSAAAKGAAFDSTYMAGQVMAHEATLQKLKDASGMAQNADLKQMLTNAQGPVQKHLDRAREIQGKLK